MLLHPETFCNVDIRLLRIIQTRFHVALYIKIQTIDTWSMAWHFKDTF